MLARVCRIFNSLCGTAWPDDLVSAGTHLCGPPQQPEDDEWSCGFRLLRAWSLICGSLLPWTPLGLSEACAPMAFESAEQLVQGVRAQYRTRRARGQDTGAHVDLLSYARL